MLTNESLLQVLLFADYKTLVLAKFAARRFLHLAAKFANELARRRRFGVTIYADCIMCGDVTIGSQRGIGYVRCNQTSLAAACREVHDEVGPHAVAALAFYGATWNMPGVDVIFEAAPPLKYAEDVALFIPYSSTTGSKFEAFMSSFAGMKSLRLCLEEDDEDEDTDRLFSWTFLRQESARELRIITMSTWTTISTHMMSRCIEELVRYCVTLPHMISGEPLEVDLSKNDFSVAFVSRIIELLKSNRCDVTFRMRTDEGDELELDKSDYRVDVDGTTTRYASEESGIVVEVNGRSVTIQSSCREKR